MMYGPKAFSFSEDFWSPPAPGSLPMESGASPTIYFQDVSGSGWSFSVQLYNVDTDRWTIAKTATSSNPQVTFTDMLSGHYRAYVQNNLPGTSWSGWIYIMWA
jgi:hypothetical protein